jgi:hypothetical protein
MDIPVSPAPHSRACIDSDLVRAAQAAAHSITIYAVVEVSAARNGYPNRKDECHEETLYVNTYRAERLTMRLSGCTFKGLFYFPKSVEDLFRCWALFGLLMHHGI